MGKAKPFSSLSRDSGPLKLVAAIGSHSNGGSFSRELAIAGKRFKGVGRIQSGMKTKIVAELAQRLDLPITALSKLIRIAPATLNRRRESGNLSIDESDRVYRVESTLRKTTEFFEGDADAAKRWLNTPAHALGGVRPIALLGNEAGVREVEALLGRLEYGVFT